MTNKKFNWKKELISWAVMIAVFGTLYLTGLHTPVIGKIQSLLLSTHLITPDLDQKEAVTFNFNGILKSSDGTVINSEELSDKTIFINYWATWCPPCLGELPHINKLYQQVKSDPNVVFLLISKDQDFNKAIRFMDKKEYDLPIYTEVKGFDQLSSRVLPSSYVIKNGEIVFETEGMSNFNTQEFKDFLISRY